VRPHPALAPSLEVCTVPALCLSEGVLSRGLTEQEFSTLNSFVTNFLSSAANAMPRWICVSFTSMSCRTLTG
jgi:hypothetical protein